MGVFITLITIAGVAGLIASSICIIKLDDKIKSILNFLITSIISEILFIVALVLSTVVTVAFSIGMSICGVTLAFVFVCSAISHLNEYKGYTKNRKLMEQQQRLKGIKYNIIMLKKKQGEILSQFTSSVYAEQVNLLKCENTTEDLFIL